MSSICFRFSLPRLAEICQIRGVQMKGWINFYDHNWINLA